MKYDAAFAALEACRLEALKPIQIDVLDIVDELPLSVSASDKLSDFIAAHQVFVMSDLVEAIVEDRAFFERWTGPRVASKIYAALRDYIVARVGRSAFGQIAPAPVRATDIPGVSVGALAPRATILESAEALAAALELPRALELPLSALPHELLVHPATTEALYRGTKRPETIRALLAAIDKGPKAAAVRNVVERDLATWFRVRDPQLKELEAQAALEATPLPEGSPFRVADAELAQAVKRGAQSAFYWSLPEYAYRVDPRAEKLFVSVDRSARFFEFDLSAWPSLGPKLNAVFEDVLHALRRFLRSPGEPGHEQLVAFAASPRWPRLFAQFDLALERLPRPAAANGEERVAYRLGLTRRDVSLELIVQRRSKSGGWSRGARLGSDAAWKANPIADAHDRRVLDAFALETRADPTRLYASSPRHYGRILEALVGHPRVLVGDAPVAVRRVAAAVEFIEQGEELAVRVRVGRHSRALEEVTITDEDPVVVDVASDPSTLAFARLPLAAHRLLVAFRDRPTTLPESSWPELLKRLQMLGAEVPAILPPGLEGDELRVPVSPVVELSTVGEQGLSVRLAAHVPGHLTRLDPGEGSPRMYVQVAGKRHVLVRDLEGEVAAMHAIAAKLGLADRAADAEGQGRDFLATELEPALAIVEAAESLGEGVEVRWASPKIRVDRPIASSAVRLRVGAGAGYFTVGGDAAVDDATVELVDIVAALRRGERFVNVGAGRFARISEDLRSKLAAITSASEARKKERDLAVADAALPFLGELVEGTEGAKLTPDLVERVAAWRAASKATFEAPAHLRSVLRPYQAEGFAWLARLAAWGAGAILADDMGLGKTLQSIALLEHRGARGPALVVAPTSVGPNWEAELARFGTGLRVRVYRGPNRAGVLEKLRKRDVVVTSWDIAVRDEEALAAIGFATIVFDEAQSAKNAATRRAAMAGRLQASFRLALSGTPIENHLGELWSIFSFTLPGLLGSRERFRERFALPIERDHSSERRQALSSIVTPFVLRRTKELVEKDLPSLTETTTWVELSDDERVLYEAMRREALASLEGKMESGKDHILFLAWLTRLRQLACHPKLVLESSSVPSSKLAAVLEVVTALREERHRMLVFSQFTEHLALVRAELEAARIPYQYLDGSTPAEARKRAVEAFQAGDGDVFLLSLKAGGVGINLTGATHVLHLDPWWNPAVEDQATDRAHRIGQTRPVTSIRFVAKGTVEAAIVGVRERKRELANAVLEGTDVAAKLSQAELLDLVRSGLEG
jgi:superfamily II DNA or RNA helicase